MFAYEHDAVAQCELLVGPLLHGFLEGGAHQEHRSRSGDNPADMQRVLIPHLDAETHIGDVVQVRVLKLPEQFVYAFVEAAIRPAHKVGLGAQAL